MMLIRRFEAKKGNKKQQEVRFNPSINAKLASGAEGKMITNHYANMHTQNICAHVHTLRPLLCISHEKGSIALYPF